MTNDGKMKYLLVVLMAFTVLIYFLAASQDSEELKIQESNSQIIVAHQIELTLFLIVGLGYMAMLIWILVEKTNLIFPYLITMIGSILLIGIYLLAITKGLPIVGVEEESDILATVSKMLQASIISIIAIQIFSARTKKVSPAISTKQNDKNCALCGREIIDELSSVILEKPDGTKYIFDTDNCMKYFQKLSNVYGDNLT